MSFMDYIRSKVVSLCFTGIGIIILTVFFSITSGIGFALISSGVFLIIIFIWCVFSSLSIKK